MHEIAHLRVGDTSPEIEMTATFEEFDSTKEEWPQYVERLSHFFNANRIQSAERNAPFYWLSWDLLRTRSRGI